ncbi:MAG: restriction endonuclease [Rhodospirillaceae bacterium]|nr:restriction endonuclease [Rhodospirillaceae bacterium]
MTQAMWGLHMDRSHGMAPIQGGYVVIGWPQLGDLSRIPKDRDSLKARLISAYADAKPGAVPVQAGVLYRFVWEIAVSDIVVYPSKPDRTVNIGLVDGGYEYAPDLNAICPNRRKVRWVRHLPRAEFSQSALHEIGSAMTLFQITTHAEEFRAALEGKGTGAEDVDDTMADEVSLQVEESTEDFIIKRLKSKLKPHEFEQFVAHLLTCMGYYARVTQRSSDGGIDVIAHKDELGFEPPIIKVQCKQTLDQIGRPTAQQLHGAIEHGEHGLFVTLGGYSAEARTFERSKPNLRFIDGNDLIELIYAHYDRFDPRYKMLLPLKRTYIPGTSLAMGD